MSLKTFTLSCLFLFSFILVTDAQTGSVRGNVYEKDTGEPVAYGNVRIGGTTIGTTTDQDGFFSITNVPVGSYELIATYIGFDSIAVNIVVKKNQILNEQLQMTEGATNLGVVEVSGKKIEARTKVQISKVTLSAKKIKALPSIGGEADIAQYLPVIPGIIFTGDQGGQLYIRGGSPVQNRILLDGMTIINPFHSLGFFSVFETETIRSVDVLTGGFPAEYGGRISAVVDIKTREGNKKRFGGIVSANPFQAKVLLEGPLKKLNDEGSNTSVSYILTAKHSYIDQVSPTIYPYAADSTGLPFSFTDIYGKISVVAPKGSKLNAFGMRYTDRVSYDGIADLNWKMGGGGVNFKVIPAASSFIIGGTIAFSNYQIELDEFDDAPRESSIANYSADINFTSFGENSELKYGFQFTGFNTNFKFRNFLGITFEQRDFNTDISLYAKYRQSIGKLIIEPSFRVQFYASQSDFSFEPRLGLKYNITDRFRFKLAGGLYSQNLVSTVNERDVVNLFAGFLSGPEETIFKPGTTEKVDHRLQKSVHAIGGFEIDLSNRIELNVEPYYKGFTQLIAINRTKKLAEDPDFSTETGKAYGVDFSLKYETKKTYLWATYSLGFVNRNDGEQIYPTIFDRRHNINFLVTQTLGNDKAWEASVRWNMGSGFPFTLTQGFYDKDNLEEGIGTNINESNGDLGIIYSDKRNDGRLPYYHRLDMSVKRTFTFNKYRKLEVTLSATNVYNRKNIFFFDRVEYERVNQLPILPSLGFIFSF